MEIPPRKVFLTFLGPQAVHMCRPCAAHVLLTCHVPPRPIRPGLTNFARYRLVIAKISPEFGPVQVAPGHFSPELDHTRPNLAEIRPNLAAVFLNSAEFGLMLGQLWPDICPIIPKLTNVCLVLAKLD